MREPVGECYALALVACSRSRPTWHVREEAGSYDGKASFPSESQIDHCNRKVTRKDDDLTDNLRDEHSARHLGDHDSFCAPRVFHDRVLLPFSLTQEKSVFFHVSAAMISLHHPMDTETVANVLARGSFFARSATRCAAPRAADCPS